jgi:IS605 OrfB family transposase
MMGIDLNPREVGWAITNATGNLIASGSIPYSLDEKKTNQARDILALVVKELVGIASQYQVPITVEKLDFTEKKRQLKERGARYAKMLSSFAYSKFDELLTSRCVREGIPLYHRSAAWSSLIGMVKFMKRYGLSSATAAALVMARRGQRYSERLPARYARLLQVDGKRHVWSHWRMFKRKLVLKLPRHGFFDLDRAISEYVVKLEMEQQSVKKPRDNPASSTASC